MSNQEQEAFFAGIVEARGTAYVKNSSRGRRPHLEVMFRNPETAAAFQEHFGGAGQIRQEYPSYRPDVTNYVYRVRGQAALGIIERLLPYLQGRSAEACASVLERCSKVA